MKCDVFITVATITQEGVIAKLNTWVTIEAHTQKKRNFGHH